MDHDWIMETYLVYSSSLNTDQLKVDLQLMYFKKKNGSTTEKRKMIINLPNNKKKSAENPY